MTISTVPELPELPEVPPAPGLPGARLRPLLPWRLTPVGFRPERAARVLARNLRVYRRGWFYIASGFCEPFLYLLSIGIGLGHLVGGLSVSGRALSYAQYVAPGLLASQAMNGAIVDSTFSLFFKLKYAHTYEAVLATPITTGDVAVGELGWALARGTIYSAAFLAVMAGLGMVRSPWAALCLPVAVLIAFAFAGLGMAVTSYLRSWQDLDTVFLAVLPLFLFSGTFYPLSLYPGAVAWIVRFSPLYHGVIVLRALDAGVVGWSLLWHVAVLAGLGLVGIAVTARRLQRLLAP